MNVLLLGSGGREHAIIYKIKQNPDVQKIFCIPGNGGILQDVECFNFPLNDFDAIRRFIEEHQIDITIIGPEQPLVEGVVDFLSAAGLPVFGPGQSAARLEGSKIFAKDLMQKYGIPTAAYRSFTKYSEAKNYIEQQPDKPLVVKADGLAAGKGSVVCQNQAEALQAVKDMMSRQIFRQAGTKVVVEELMTGEEASLFVITDGKDYVTLAPAQDFKRALDEDRGKNTGGMGSYAPTPFLSPQLQQQAIREIVEPVLAALQSEGIEYRGVLYVGLMLTAEGPKVVEFNCRFGDPETQVVLPLLKTDLMEIIWAVQHQNLAQIKIEHHPGSAVCVILASGGYPDEYPTGKVITGLENVPEDLLVFHAGTRRDNGQLLTAGGRVLGVTAVDASLEQAIEKVYRGIEFIRFDGMHFRRDIARRALSFPSADQ